MSEITIPDRMTVIPRLPKTDDELWWTVQALWGMKIPRTRVCHDHCAPFDAFADAYFARSPVAVWYASRGFGGKSRTLASLTLTEAVLFGADVSLLGGSAAQSLNVHQATMDMWSYYGAPRDLLKGTQHTKWDTQLTNGAHIRSLTASQTSVRGPHPPRLRLDEIDEMDLEILEAAQGQPMRQKGVHGIIETQTVMSSTWQYPDKTMKAIMDRAKEKDWPIFSWCWKESSNPVDGWLSPDEVDRKRSEVPGKMFETEYDLQEPSFEGRAIDTAAVERMYTDKLGTFRDTDKVKLMRTGTEYITGVDWAKEKDMTVVTTYDTSRDPWIVVGWQKINRLPWPTMIAMAVDQWRYYGGYMIHDSTGIGNVVDDWIRDSIPRELHKLVIPFVMSGGRGRHDMFSNYIAAIEKDEIRAPLIQYPLNEHKYVIVKDLYGSGHPPDSIVSGALPLTMKKYKVHVGLPKGATGNSQWTV